MIDSVDVYLISLLLLADVRDIHTAERIAPPWHWQVSLLIVVAGDVTID